MRIKNTLWRSQVARSVFLLFLGCALVPLVVQAVLAGRWVETQLIEQAEERLDQLSRGAQMSVIEGIQHLDRSLVFLTAVVSPQGFASDLLDQQVWDDFTGFALMDDQGRSLASIGDLDRLPVLSDDERRFLQSGKTLLVLGRESEGTPGLLLIRHLDPENLESRLLVAQTRAEKISENEQLIAPNSEVILSDSAGRTLFASIREGAIDEELEGVLADEEHGVRVYWQFDGREYLGSSRTVFMAPQFHTNLRILYGQAKEEVLAPAVGFRRTFLLVLALTLWIVLLVSLRQIQRVLRPIEELDAGMARVASQDFSTPVEVDTRDEFQSLAESFNNMSLNLERRLRIELELHAIGMALNGENDSQRVVELILHSAQRVLYADCGSIVLAEEEGTLKIARVHLDPAGSQPEPVDSEECRIQGFSQDPPRSVAAHAAGHRGVLQFADWETEEQLDLSEERTFEQAFGVRRRAVMAVALRDHEGQILGVLQIGRLRDEIAAGAFNAEERRLLEAIASQGAIALANSGLLSGFRQMMMSMTEAFAMAVDEKSPYTGAHCKRVPELTMMLAECAKRATTGSLVEFNPTEEELFELRVAALLHDCGKVVTPVHVMDKATKLETIYDRIDMIGWRFEVLKRDARIAMLEEHIRSEGGPVVDRSREDDLHRHQVELGQTLEFLRHCNKGTEKMGDADRERVGTIASSYELQGPDGESSPLLSGDEIENLSVVHGTLTAAERSIINDHIVVTIRMLQKLHYPKGLRDVPFLAGTHHERVDGQGYPCGLTREEIPVGGRIMAIADVFEALADPDRPYRDSKSLQEALEILGKMVSSGHLDHELFQLFMDEQIYLTYAERHWEPDRIPTIHLDRIANYQPSTGSESDRGGPARRSA